MSAHTFRQRDALARMRPTVQEVRTVRSFAWVESWRFLACMGVVALAILYAAAMEVLP